MAGEREVPRSEGEEAGSRALGVRMRAHGRPDWAERGGGGGRAAAASLFPRSGRCVAARVAKGEVGRDRLCLPLKLLPSRVLAL